MRYHSQLLHNEDDKEHEIGGNDVRKKMSYMKISPSFISLS